MIIERLQIISEARRGSDDTPTRAAVHEPERKDGVPSAPEGKAPETAPSAPEAPAATAQAVQEAGKDQQPTQDAAKPAAPAIDLTADADATDEAQRKKAHEEAEARRKEELDAKQAAEKERLDRIAAMNAAELLAASVDRVSRDTEKLTRRNMKEAVAEFIRAKCMEDSAFARLVMHPAKTMIHCFQYINNRTREYAEQEMEDNAIERSGIYGTDVLDGLVYQWAVDYFNDPNAKEDGKENEKFTPKPFVPTARKTSKAKAPKKSPEIKKPAPRKPESSGAMDQISLI